MNQQNKETVTIRLSNDVISLWQKNHYSKYSELKTELENSDDLISFLDLYHRDRWKVESIYDIEICSSPDELHITYIINLFNGCKDLDENEDDNIVVEYKINLETCEIEIIGEPITEERSTRDEF